MRSLLSQRNEVDPRDQTHGKIIAMKRFLRLDADNLLWIGFSVVGVLILGAANFSSGLLHSVLLIGGFAILAIGAIIFGY